MRMSEILRQDTSFDTRIVTRNVNFFPTSGLGKFEYTGGGMVHPSDLPRLTELAQRRSHLADYKYASSHVYHGKRHIS